MFRLIKKIFLTLSSCVNPLSATELSCFSMNNQEYKVKQEIINVNSGEPVFYLFSIKTSKCSGSCNNINGPYVKMCVPDLAKNLNVKVFNLLLRANETRQIKWHETCKCKCRLDANLCNNKQSWNDDKCRCECKELIDKGVCDRGYIWNPSNCECECDKLCDVGEYLDYKNCNCRKKLVDKLVEECNGIVEEVKIVGENEDKCSSWISYIVLFLIIFIINIGIGAYFAYYVYQLKNY